MCNAFSDNLVPCTESKVKIVSAWEGELKVSTPTTEPLPSVNNIERIMIMKETIK